VLLSPQIITSIISLVTLIVSFFIKKQANEIHVLVNSKFTEALERIIFLEGELKELKKKNEIEVLSRKKHN
jgi:hypothetical protein